MTVETMIVIWMVVGGGEDKGAGRVGGQLAVRWW